MSQTLLNKMVLIFIVLCVTVFQASAQGREGSNTGMNGRLSFA